MDKGAQNLNDKRTNIHLLILDHSLPIALRVCACVSLFRGVSASEVAGVLCVWPNNAQLALNGLVKEDRLERLRYKLSGRAWTWKYYIKRDSLKWLESEIARRDRLFGSVLERAALIPSFRRDSFPL